MTSINPNEIACQIALRDKRSLRRQEPGWLYTLVVAGIVAVELVVAVVIIREAL